MVDAVAVAASALCVVVSSYRGERSCISPPCGFWVFLIDEMRFCICGGCSNSDLLSDHLRFHSFPDRRKDGAGFRAWVHFVQVKRKDFFFASVTKYTFICAAPLLPLRVFVLHCHEWTQSELITCNNPAASHRQHGSGLPPTACRRVGVSV